MSQEEGRADASAPSQAMNPELDPWPSVEEPEVPECPYCQAVEGEAHEPHCPMVDPMDADHV
jgi:hypothetical protein